MIARFCFIPFTWRTKNKYHFRFFFFWKKLKTILSGQVIIRYAASLRLTTKQSQRFMAIESNEKRNYYFRSLKIGSSDGSRDKRNCSWCSEDKQLGLFEEALFCSNEQFQRTVFHKGDNYRSLGWPSKRKKDDELRWDPRSLVYTCGEWSDVYRCGMMHSVISTSKRTLCKYTVYIGVCNVEHLLRVKGSTVWPYERSKRNVTTLKRSIA